MMCITVISLKTYTLKICSIHLSVEAADSLWDGPRHASLKRSGTFYLKQSYTITFEESSKKALIEFSYLPFLLVVKYLESVMVLDL